MEKVTISNEKGENGLVNVVRYFQNNGTQYLIYSLNEVDEAGYTRLYVVKINGVNGNYTAEMPNESEWNDVKNLIKLIVKANKEGMPVPVQDINPKKLTNIILKDKKVFKLNTSLVNDLESNKTSFDDEKENNVETQSINPNNSFEIPSAPSFEQPAQPSYEIPSAPDFNAQSFSSFESPVQPTFDMPAQQFDFNNKFTSINNNQNSEIDNTKEISDINQQNEEMKKEIEHLKQEIEHYKLIMSNLKEIIEK